MKLSDVIALELPLLHWASNAAPEVMLVNTLILPVVVKMIARQEMPQGDDLTHTLCMFGEGVQKLVAFDRSCNEGLAESGKISATLASLLTVSVQLVRAGLKGRDPCVPGQWPTETSVRHSPFEEMVRTGSWGPSFPVCRTMPAFHQDNLTEQARLRISAKNVAKDELKEQSRAMGVACTKKPTKHRALTPGIFTIFCSGCGMCVLFEMMDHAECPLTPFKIFAHRDWTWKKQ